MWRARETEKGFSLLLPVRAPTFSPCGKEKGALSSPLRKMDWPTGDMLLLGVDVEEFRLEKNIKPEKVLFKDSAISLKFYLKEFSYCSTTPKPHPNFISL